MFISDIPALRALSTALKPTVAPAQSVSEPSSAPAQNKVQKFLNLINSERKKAGLTALVLDESLSTVALGHSKNMVEKDFFDHTSPSGKKLKDRLKDGGINYTTAGENIVLASTIEKANQSLFDSPGHRANLLNPDFTHIGIGIVENSEGSLVATQVFTHPVDKVDEPKLVNRIISDINSRRVRRGLLPLNREPRLQEAARANSQQLARTGRFDFTNLRKQLELRQVTFRNIQAHLFHNPSVQSIIDTPTILDPKFGNIGLGIIQQEQQNGNSGPLGVTLLLATES